MENTNITNEEIQAAIQALFDKTDALQASVDKLTTKVDVVEGVAYGARNAVTSLKTKVNGIKAAPTNKYDMITDVSSNIGTCALALGVLGFFGWVVYQACKPITVDEKKGEAQNEK